MALQDPVVRGKCRKPLIARLGLNPESVSSSLHAFSKVTLHLKQAIPPCESGSGLIKIMETSSLSHS